MTEAKQEPQPARRHVKGEQVFEVLAAEFGCSRQRVHQLYLQAIHKLTESTRHLQQIEWRLAVALSRYRAAQRRDDVPEMLRRIIVVDELADAVKWLRAARSGELEDLLRDAEQRQDEPTVYTGTFHSQDRVMQSSVSGKWKGRHLATKGAGR
jgi:hypothetical protein